MPALTLPKLPLVCLKTADFKDTNQVVEGKNTIIGELFEVFRFLFVSISRADTVRLMFLCIEYRFLDH